MAFSARLNFATQATIADPETISIADAGGYFTTDNVEAALQETGSQLAQKANKTQEAWVEPTLLNNWVNTYGTAKSRYFKDNFGIVHLEVNVKRDSASGVAIFQLPTGYRPSQYIFFVAGSSITSETVPVNITTAGNLECGYGYALNVTFTLSFKAV